MTRLIKFLSANYLKRSSNQKIWTHFAFQTPTSFNPEHLIKRNLHKFTTGFPMKTLRPLELTKTPYALLILNQPISLESGLLTKIWNKARIRGLVDGGADRFIDIYRNGEDLATPTFISGDLDSIKSSTLDFFQKIEKVRIIKTPDQDETDFTKAIRVVEDLQKTENLQINHVIVLAEHTGRLDQVMGNLHTLIKTKNIFQIYILNRGNLTFLIGEGETELIFPPQVLPQDDQESKNTCGILPFEGAVKIKSQGLKWELDGVYGFGADYILSTSNRVVSSNVMISTQSNLIFTFNKGDLCAFI